LKKKQQMRESISELQNAFCLANSTDKKPEATPKLKKRKCTEGEEEQIILVEKRHVMAR